MKKKDTLRKCLTFGADSLSIIAGSITCVLIYHPAASFSDNLVIILAFIPMVLVTMALISVIIKTYHRPIMDNVASSMILSIGAFALAFAMSVFFLLLINPEQLNPVFLVNLLIYSVFFLGTYRLALSLHHREDGLSRNKRIVTQDGRPLKTNFNETRIEQLLGRCTARQDIQAIGSYIADKTVLISGGAGAIGFELCSQILQYNAKRVVIYDINESKLFETETELCLKYSKTQFAACLGSTQDRARLREIFDLYRPQIVIHAAAYKHVSMMESNPQEALKNNVMGTLYMVEMAIKHRADRFILLSTDMAVKPTNIMDATKRVAEMLIQRANSWSSTRFSAVRFGTVITSHGSIVQLFRKQIQEGGPIYIADKNIIRYSMTIPEAASLILEAGALSTGGDVFTLGMGSPVNIYELAQSMIRYAGLKPGKDIKIEITGARKADKSMPDNNLPDDSVRNTENERIYVLEANENPPVTFEAAFDKLCQSIDCRDYGSAFNEVSILVPTYHTTRQ